MKNGWITSQIANCLDCGQAWEDKETARKQAADHSRATGHVTNAEVVRAYHYGPPINQPQDNATDCDDRA